MRSRLRKLRARLFALVEWFVPLALQEQDPEIVRRARLAVTFVFVEVLFNANFGVFLLQSHQYAMGVVVIATSALMLVAPFVLRAGGSMWSVTNLFALATWLEANVSALVHGGMSSAGPMWLLHVPVMVMLLAGRGPALAWAALSGAAMIGWAVLEVHGIVLPVLGPPVVLGERTFGTLTLLIMFVALSWAYESVKERMRRDLDRVNREMRLVLDNVGQGFLVIERDARIGPQRSTAVEQWLGPLAPDKPWWSYVFGADDHLASWAELGWQGVIDDILPLALSLEQLPRTFERTGRSYSVSYRPLLRGNGALQKVIVVINDVTDINAAERGQELRRQYADILARAMRDRDGFREFVEEAQLLVQAVAAGAPALGPLHTLKGNCSLYDVYSMVKVCHALESQLIDERRDATPEERQRVALVWHEFCEWSESVLGSDRDRVVVDRSDYESLLKAVETRSLHADLAARLRSWMWEPIERRFDRIGSQALVLAEGIGKPGLVVDVSAPAGLRLLSARWAPFFRDFVHVVRNALDHGIESPPERATAGKPPEGHLALSAAIDGNELVLALADDGRGVDWQALRSRALELGLPASTQAQLEAALFADGVSSRRHATELSGRGVGMGCLLRTTREIGGRIVLHTTAGAGTTWQFRFPAALALAADGENPPARPLPHTPEKASAAS